LFVSFLGALVKGYLSFGACRCFFSVLIVRLETQGFGNDHFFGEVTWNERKEPPMALFIFSWKLLLIDRCSRSDFVFVENFALRFNIEMI